MSENGTTKGKLLPFVLFHCTFSFSFFFLQCWYDVTPVLISSFSCSYEPVYSEAGQSLWEVQETWYRVYSEAREGTGSSLHLLPTFDPSLVDGRPQLQGCTSAFHHHCVCEGVFTGSTRPHCRLAPRLIQWNLLPKKGDSLPTKGTVLEPFSKQ